MRTLAEPTAHRLGFPDYRTRPPSEISWEDDLALATELERAAGRMRFAELAALLYRLRPPARPELQQRHLAHFEVEAEQAAAAMERLAAAGPGALLDVGCGMGRYVAAAVRAGRPATGVDVALYQVVLARKLLEQEGLEARLLLANAEALPFEDGAFAAATATDLLEHVEAPERTVAEVGRALGPGGMAYFTTPNRYSLTAEPHVGIWGLGYLPRSRAERLVKRRLGIDYGPIRPLSYPGLRRLLAGSFPGDSEVRPGAPEPRELATFPPLKRVAARAYLALGGVPLARAAVARVAPYFVATGRRR